MGLVPLSVLILGMLTIISSLRPFGTSGVYALQEILRVILTGIVVPALTIVEILVGIVWNLIILSIVVVVSGLVLASRISSSIDMLMRNSIGRSGTLCTILIRAVSLVEGAVRLVLGHASECLHKRVKRRTNLRW